MTHQTGGKSEFLLGLIQTRVCFHQERTLQHQPAAGAPRTSVTLNQDTTGPLNEGGFLAKMDQLCHAGNGSSGGANGPEVDLNCYLELSSTVIAVIFIFASIIVTTVVCCRHYYGTPRESTHTKFSGHHLRAIIIIIMIFLHSMELGEYGVAHEPASTPPHILLTSTSSILALVAGAVFHSTIENRGLVKCLFVHATYSFAMFAFRVLRWVHLKERLDLDWSHIRLVLCATTCCGFALLTFVDCLALMIEIKSNPGSGKIFIKSSKNMESDTFGYKHNRSNTFSQMIYWWLNSLLVQGFKEPLELEDLGKLPKEEGTTVCFQKFLTIYKTELSSVKKNNKTISLWKCYFKFIYKNYCIGGILKLLGDVIGLIGPLSISFIIQYTASYGTENPDYSRFLTVKEFLKNGYIIGIIVLVSALVQGTLSQSSTHLVNIEGIRLKSALQSLIYDKSMKLALWSSPNINNINSQDDYSTTKSVDNSKDDLSEGGSIINLVSEDSYNVMSFIWIGHYVWAIPLKIGILMYLLHLQLGISAIIGATVCICIMTPLQFRMGKSMSVNSKMCVDFSDQRMMKINEVLQAIKTLKMYAWESIYEEKIKKIRDKELEYLNKDSFYWALITFLTHASSALITLVTFGLYFIIEEKSMSPENVFAGLALFNQLTVPLFIFPVTVPIFISAMVSSKRIREFLMLPEINKLNRWGSSETQEYDASMKSVVASLSLDSTKSTLYTLGNIQEMEEENDMEEIFDEITLQKDNQTNSSVEDINFSSDDLYTVKLNNSIFVWGNSEDAYSKLNISGSIEIPKGKLTVVVGKSNSGKSSFLSALLGEMNLIKGKLAWLKNSSVAYCSQKPWLVNGTIKENIIFGNATITRRYKKVLSACALRTDLSSLPNKDQTEVGEAGCTISGGQKQRVCLARAIYSNACVLILDDPLAALDLPVGERVFEKGIKRLCLNQNRTVIMVTHQFQLLQVADQIIHVDSGSVRAMGSLVDVEKTEPELANEWKTSILKNQMEDNSNNRDKTAKERWQLIKLVNKCSLKFRSKSDDEMDNKIEAPFIPMRKRHTSFYGSRYFTHELSLPNDQCDDDAIRNSITKRQSVRRTRLKSMTRSGQKPHKVAERSSSLQVVKHKVKPAPMTRQSSSPSINCNQDETDINTRLNQRSIGAHQQRYVLRQLFPISSQKFSEMQNKEDLLPRQKSLIRRILTRSVRNKKTRSNLEKEHVPVKRLISSNSTQSEEIHDDEDLCSDNTSTDKYLFDEEREYGKIPKKVYLEYFLSCGIFVGCMYLASTIAWQFMRVYTDMWLSEWTNSGNHKDHLEKSHLIQYLIAYSALSIVSIVLSFLSNALGQYAGALARKILHAKLLSNLIRCPMNFFEKTPFGRIINRFSTDIGIIDKKIATSMQRLLQFFFLCVSGILINSVINPWFLIIIALPICIIYYIIQKFYRSTARELQRIDSITKSPVFSHFNETLQGLASIRAYNRQTHFWNSLWNKMDVNTNSFIILNSSNRWLGIALDYLGGLLVFAAIIASLISIQMNPKNITPSLIGLAINYTLLVPMYLNWVVKFLSDMEMYMSAVERVQQYSSLNKEDFRELDLPASKNWLRRGEVVFSGVSLRYGDTKELIIKNLNLHIPAGQKIAICGRTGSGKSSLLMSLLRMVEISEGNIMIDGNDITSVSLNDLRSKISIVPQDVILFSGTVRDNLNPTNKIDDETIWRVLELIKFKDIISSYPGGLDGYVSEGGAGWSGGARQMLGIARSFLKNSPLLLMDEPTAALDPQTEASILLPFLESQRKSTIITVAHRLSTIVDYDRVIVLDSGCIVEDGNPKELLSKPMSIFATMAKSVNR